jgi:imidazoleglycerol-phosphate dehydratase
MTRTATVHRVTGETDVRVTLDLDGAGRADVITGLGFLDHMLSALHIDDHHPVEDVALAIGEALAQAAGERRGIRRFGHAYAPLDEALARAVIDLSGRPWPAIDLGLRRQHLGTVATENLTHWFQSFAMAGRLTLHVDVLKGDNDHHRCEAAFKALALALRDAVARTGTDEIPSTKGVLA